MMRWMPCLLLLFAAMRLLARDDAPFTPKVSAVAANRVALEALPGSGLPILHARLDGVPCVLLFDTGASHTTFDRGFLERAFPTCALRPAVLNGTTNVAAAPQIFRIGALTLGDATLRDFLGMALPLDHLAPALGGHVDGILGMNAMAYAPFVLDLGKGEVTWSPEGTPAASGVPLPVAKEEGSALLRLTARTAPEVEAFPVLVDSGATHTVVEGACWPEGEAPHAAFSAADVNAAEARRLRKGNPGHLLVGDVRLPVTPLLGDGDRRGAVLGADVLRKVVLSVDARRRAVSLIEPSGTDGKETP